MADVVHINEMLDMLTRLADQVTRLTGDVRSLWPSVATLVGGDPSATSHDAEEAGSHSAYLGGTGPAVRASIIDGLQDMYNSRIKELEESNQNIEAAVAMVVETNKEQQVKYEENQKMLEEEMRNLKSTADASFNRASGGFDSKGKNHMIT